MKTKDFSDLFFKEFQKLGNFCVSLKTKVDVLYNETKRLVEDLTTFNKDYSGDLKVKSEIDAKIFGKVEKSLSEFQETLLKVKMTRKMLIIGWREKEDNFSQESILKNKSKRLIIIT